MAGAAALRRAQALLPWLGRHARHIRRLECRALGGGAAAPPDDAPALAALAASCLATACVNARRLQALVINWATPLLTLSWLPLVAPTLEELTIRLVGQPLKLDTCLGSMTALRDARLSADAITLAPGVRLPPRLSSLMFFNAALHPDAALPPQVGWLRVGRCARGWVRQALAGGRCERASCTRECAAGRDQAPAATHSGAATCRPFSPHNTHTHTQTAFVCEP